MGVALDLSRLRKTSRRRRAGAAGRDARRPRRPWSSADQRARRRSASAPSSTASIASTRSSARAAWARCFARGTCGSSAPVAIKVVRADLIVDRPMRARASTRESQIVARLQHPSIVTVFDYGNARRRRGVPGDGVRAGRRPAADAQAREDASIRRGWRPLMTGIAGGVDIGAPVGHLSPRSETGEHPAADKRHGTQGRGLRRRQAEPRQPGRGRQHDLGGRHDRRHAGLHGARNSCAARRWMRAPTSSASA